MNGTCTAWAGAVAALWAAAAAAALVGLCTALRWRAFGWRWHPLVRALDRYPGHWRAAATSLNAQFMRHDKLVHVMGQRLVVTESWIALVEAYRVRLAHQNGVDMSIVGSRTLRQPGGDAEQVLSIRVTSLAGDPFTIRLPGPALQELQDKIERPIRNMRRIAIQQTLTDQFLAVLRGFVDDAEPYDPPPGDEPNRCAGCMERPSTVKVLRCPCRPMWCLLCIGKWFASQQDQHDHATWLVRIPLAPPPLFAR